MNSNAGIAAGPAKAVASALRREPCRICVGRLLVVVVCAVAVSCDRGAIGPASQKETDLRKPDRVRRKEMERLAANGPFAPGAPPVPSGKGREVRGAPIQAETLARLDAFRDRASRGDSAGQPDGDVFEPIAALMARFRETSDPADQEEIIRSLAHREESEGRKLLLEAALGDGTPEVRMAALEALAEAPREEDLVAVVAALDSPEAGVKDAGIWLLGNLRTEKSLPLWRQVLASPSPDLVMIGFEALAQAPEPLQVEVARSGLSSPQPWIVEHALVVLGGIVSKPAVEALIPAVDHAVSGDLAKDGLLYLLGESFETSAEAGAWWRANESRLDADLQPSETPPRVP